MFNRSVTLALVLFGFTRGAGAQQPNRASCSAAAALRSERFDCAILLQNAFEAALIAWLARIPVRIG